MSETLLHGTCVAVDGPEGATGVLIRGPSGAGKSDLALRLIDQGARLVADDQCVMERRAPAGGHGPGANRGAIVVRPPSAIAGRIEVRGVGIVSLPATAEAPLGLVVDLVGPEAVERLPANGATQILGESVPRLALYPFEASAPAKVRAALRSAGAHATKSPSAGPARASNRPETHDEPPARRRRVVLVTGLSGAGHSTALKILEDMGYEAIDNLPLNHLGAVLAEGDSDRPVAVGVDIRTRRFAAERVIEQLDCLRARPLLDVTLVFLDCESEVLERRFTETRRRHPLAPDRRVADGIAAERRLVEPLQAHAHLVIDTSSLSPGALGRVLGGHLGLDAGQGMAIFITSFSYRNGLPREADLVFDARFLANPHYVPELRPRDGRDPRVAAHIEADPAYAGFFERLTGMLEPLLPRYEQEGKSYLTIAIGCTGGRHRSVMVAERLAAWLRARGRTVDLAHRGAAAPDSPHNGRDSRAESR